MSRSQWMSLYPSMAEKALLTYQECKQPESARGFVKIIVGLCKKDAMPAKGRAYLAEFTIKVRAHDLPCLRTGPKPQENVLRRLNNANNQQFSGCNYHSTARPSSCSQRKHR